jgi:hypothetical protein
VNARPTQALYAYAIVRACEIDLSGAGAVGAAGSARTCAHGGLALVVSDIEPSELESVSTDDLGEGGELASLARRHDAVVRAASEQTATLPLRFGTVLSDPRAVADLLERHAREADELLAAVAGHQEWGVRLRIDAGHDPPRMPEQAAPTSGTEYLARRRRERTERTEHQDLVRDSARRAHEKLATRARTTVPRAPREPDVVSDAAYLVAAERTDGFLADAEQLAEELRAIGMRVETTGPWPPYSFARDGLSEIA